MVQVTPDATTHDAAMKLLEAAREYAREAGLFPENPGKFTFDMELTYDIGRSKLNIRLFPKRKSRRQLDLEGLTSHDRAWALNVREFFQRSLRPRWRR